MGEFSYTAIDSTGKTAKGAVTAESADAARGMLAAKGLIPTNIEEKSGEGGLQGLLNKLSTVKTPDLILFTKQVKTMFSAGISILVIFEILEDQTTNPKLKAAIKQIAEDIKQGSNLFNAFSKHSDIFTPLYCSMIRAGEMSGNLPEVMDRLIYIIEHEYKVNKQIKSALTYPVVVIVLLVVAFIFLLTFVIPKFVTMFSSSGVALPLPTQVCLVMYQALKNYWHVMVGGLTAGVAAIVWYVRTPGGRLAKDRFFLRMPLFGPVMRKGAMSRFSSIFAILQASGVSVLDSVVILTETIGNSAISLEFENLRAQLEEGRGISGPLRKSKYFTPMIINMISIGEETGNLDEMLQEVSNHYDYEVEHAIQRMTELIGPILMCLLSGVVGFFALAIYLPLVDVIKTMK